MNWEEFEGNGRGLILRNYPGIRLKELSKITKNLRHCRRCPGRNLNLGTPKYEAVVLNGRTRRSVSSCTVSTVREIKILCVYDSRRSDSAFVRK
jgi:hypothetical protein